MIHLAYAKMDSVQLGIHNQSRNILRVGVIFLDVCKNCQKPACIMDSFFVTLQFFRSQSNLCAYAGPVPELLTQVSPVDFCSILPK